VGIETRVVRGGNKPAIFQVRAMNVSPEQIKWVLISVLVLVASVAIHEFGHAKMADLLGDDTPRRQGRVTLNPLAHADPIGTLLLPLIGGLYVAGGGLSGGFGWGRPVQWQPTRIHRKWRMATAQILVAVAGPSMNVVLALVVCGLHAILWHAQVLGGASELNTVLTFTVQTNFILFFFNLVPVPPLDGGHVADGLMPYKHRSTFESFARFGPFIVMALVMIPQIAQIFRVPAAFCTVHLYGLFGITLG
jgi:Zn-dependent protease